MKKAISIFPKEFGFFPYIFLVYTIMPFLSLLKESGVKQGIGYGMLLLFVAAYRQLFCSVGKASFTYWLIVQMAVILMYSVFYNITYIYLGFFPANFVGYYKEKTNFNRAFCALIFILLFHAYTNLSRIRSRSGSFFLFSRSSSLCSFLHSAFVLCFGELSLKLSLHKPTNR